MTAVRGLAQQVPPRACIWNRQVRLRLLVQGPTEERERERRSPHLVSQAGPQLPRAGLAPPQTDVQGEPRDRTPNEPRPAATTASSEGKATKGLASSPRLWQDLVATPDLRGHKAAGSLSALQVSKFFVSPTMIFSEKNKT